MPVLLFPRHSWTTPDTMRSITLVLLALTVALVVTTRCCDGANVRNLPVLDDEEEFRPRHFYRDYALIRSRAARADDAFDDYGHLRFGRSED